MKKRVGALLLLLVCCLAWASSAWAADSGSHSLPALGKLEIRRLLDAAPTNLNGVELFATKPVYTAPYAAGNLSTTVKQRALARFNALRRIAGLPGVTLDEELGRKAQHAAVLMTATNYASGSGKPHEPEQPSGMSADFYALGSAGAANGNLYRATDLMVAIDYWLDDPGQKNLADLGHRRWQLNPQMGKVGFGYSAGTDSYNPCSVAWVTDKSGAAVDYDFVAWPSSGNFPAEIFAKDAPWSVSLNPDKYQVPEQKAVTLKLTRLSDGKSWSFAGNRTWEKSDKGSYFNVSTHRYGLNNCIVFRPEGIGLYDGAYQVDISGLKDKNGQAASLSYTVDFFGAPRNFNDVRSNDYFAGAVKWVVSAGIASGVSNSSFAPNDTCTHGEILTMLWRANGSPAAAEQPMSGLDGKFYRTAAMWAGSEGLIAGSSFDGDKPCSRGEVVYYLWTLAGKPQAGQASSFADVPEDLAQAVAWAVEKKITTGATAETFEPKATCTRGQIATFIYRAYRW